MPTANVAQPTPTEELQRVLGEHYAGWESHIEWRQFNEGQLVTLARIASVAFSQGTYKGFCEGHDSMKRIMTGNYSTEEVAAPRTADDFECVLNEDAAKHGATPTPAWATNTVIASAGVGAVIVENA